MYIIKAKNRTELLQKIQNELDPSAKEVYIDVRPSIQIIISILNKAPSINSIHIPKSLYEETPRKIKNALNKVQIKLLPSNIPQGRPKTHSEKKIDSVFKLSKEGKTAKMISIETGLPLRTVYYYLKKE
ncbi:MAG TPA: DUF1699 family protein [archaeon]|nr:DUF1699 family protein [archaeon]